MPQAMQRTLWSMLLVSMLLLLLAACNGMENQPKYEPLEASTFWENGMASRPVIDNTGARGQLQADSLLYAGQVDGAPATEYPFPVTSEVLERGQERYDIYCAPCHGYAGYGDGVVVARGLRPPPSFHADRLRAAPVGHFFDVMTNGFGTMYSYADRIAPEDRWAIVAYIQALQMSQNATVDDVPPEAQSALEATPEEGAGGEDAPEDASEAEQD
jgi:mono/diheme cytochrome c family protein